MCFYDFGHLFLNNSANFDIFSILKKENKALMLYPWIYVFTNINPWLHHVMKETDHKTDIDAKMNVISMVHFTKFYKINFSNRFLGLKIIKN